MAVPLRARTRLRRGRGARRGLVASYRTPALVGVPGRPIRRIRRGARGIRSTDRPAPARRARLRRISDIRGGRMARCRRSRRPSRRATAAGSRRRHGGARGSVVGAQAPSGEGACTAHTCRVAGHLPRYRPARIGGHVRGCGSVGMADAAPPGSRPDDRRRDRAYTRHRIGAWHLPRGNPRLPHPRRQGQSLRTARSRHRSAR